jgi:hypothetical protein
MTDWQPYREPLRTTLVRTVSIALLAGALVALWSGGLRRWPAMSLLMLWPAFGGHWVDLLFLNYLRPRPRVAWLTWAIAGVAFITIELIAHAALHLRGRPSFYNGLG